MTYTQKIKYSVVSLLLIALAHLHFGCAASCKQVTEDRLAFTKRTVKSPKPHMEITVPFALANQIFEKQLKKIKVVKVKIPGLGPMAEYVDKISIRPGRLVMKTARPGHIGFTLNCDVMDGKKKLFSATAEAEVEPKFDQKGGVVEIALRPDMLLEVKPRLNRKAKKRLGEFIYRHIPKMARLVISERMAREVAAEAISLWSSGFFELLRGTVLEDIGELSRIRIELPDVPIEDLKITSDARSGGFLRIQIHTALPIASGLAEGAPRDKTLSKKAVRLRVSGAAMAELGNWAFAEGHIPSRYNTDGKPDEEGEIEPGLGWVSGPNPMKAYIWKTERPCMRLRVGATPKIAIRDNNLHIETNEVTVEEVKGSPAVKAAVWFYTLWADAIKVHQKLATQMKFRLSGTTVEVKIAKATIENDELVMALTVKTKN